jgi:hypothetical protein
MSLTEGMAYKELIKEKKCVKDRKTKPLACFFSGENR